MYCLLKDCETAYQNGLLKFDRESSAMGPMYPTLDPKDSRELSTLFVACLFILAWYSLCRVSARMFARI